MQKAKASRSDEMIGKLNDGTNEFLAALEMDLKRRGSNGDVFNDVEHQLEDLNLGDSDPHMNKNIRKKIG